MKNKYDNNACKGKNGSDLIFSKPHEQKLFELSKKLWGGRKENGTVKENMSSKSGVKRTRNSVVDF